MATCTDPQSISEYAIAYGPIITSVAIVFFAGMQWRLANNNFRLSLYQRRIGIYHKLDEFYLEYGYGMTNQCWSIDDFNAKAKIVAPYVNEAAFVFDPADGIHALMVAIVEQCRPDNDNVNSRMDEVRINMITLRKMVFPYLSFKGHGK